MIHVKYDVFSNGQVEYRSGMAAPAESDAAQFTLSDVTKSDTWVWTNPTTYISVTATGLDWAEAINTAHDGIASAQMMFRLFPVT